MAGDQITEDTATGMANTVRAGVTSLTFFDLPHELRDAIYMLTIVPDERVLHFQTPSCAHMRGIHLASMDWSPLCTPPISRQINKECPDTTAQRLRMNLRLDRHFAPPTDSKTCFTRLLKISQSPLNRIHRVMVSFAMYSDIHSPDFGKSPLFQVCRKSLISQAMAMRREIDKNNRYTFRY